MNAQESRELVLQSITQTEVFQGLFGPSQNNTASNKSSGVKFKEQTVDET